MKISDIYNKAVQMGQKAKVFAFCGSISFTHHEVMYILGNAPWVECKNKNLLI